MVLRIYSLLFFCIACLSACTQPSATERYPLRTDTLTYTLGNTPVSISLRTYNGPSPLFFVHLHDNESTAEESAITILEQYGGQLLSIINQEQRNISFQLNSQYYTFDPNRMFSDLGVAASLELLSTPHSAAIKEISGFAQFLLSHIPDSAIVVAVHNNTDERFSVLSYNTAPLKSETAAININDQHDSDDFILTTDTAVYSFYKNENINVILQSDGELTDDGSMSIFFGKKSRPYINVEAEHGHGFQQVALLEKLYTFLGVKKKNFPETQ